MVDIDVEKVLAELTLGEKVSLTAGWFAQSKEIHFVLASVDRFATFRQL